MQNIENKINYKYTTWGLLALLLILGITAFFGFGKRDDFRRNDFRNNGNFPQGMHMMQNGQMMTNDGSMMGANNDMGGMMMNMTASLQGKTGDDLDKTFLQEMIVHHQGAVDMAKVLLNSTTRPELKQFAQNIIDAQSKEIETQKSWLKQWFNIGQ